MSLNNLNLLDPATPIDGASYYELVREVRKLKEIVKTVLLVGLKPTGELRSIDSTTLSSGSVGDAQLADGCLLERHFSALCIPTGAYKSESIPSTALADGAVISRTFANNSIPGRAFVDSTIPLSAFAEPVTGTYIASHPTIDANRAIGTNHLKDLSVTDRVVNDVDFGKLTGGDDNSFLFRTGGAWTAVAVSGALSYNAGSGQFEVTTPIAAANFADTKARGLGGGDSLANTWTERSIGEISDTSTMMTFIGNEFKLVPGTYYFYARVPGYQVGAHQARLFRNNGDSTNQIVLWGSSAWAGTDGAQTDSVIQGFLLVDNEDYVYKIEHCCEVAVAGVGLGYPATSNNSVVYGNHVEVYTDGYVIRLTSDAVE